MMLDSPNAFVNNSLFRTKYKVSTKLEDTHSCKATSINMLSYLEKSFFFWHGLSSDSRYGQTPLERHTLFTTNISVEVDVAVDWNCLFSTRNISNTEHTDGFTP